MNAHIKKIINDFIDSKDFGANRGLFEPVLEQALAWVHKEVPRDVFNLAAIGADNPGTYEEQVDERKVVFQFLEKAVDFKKVPAVFLAESAPALKAQTFDNSSVFVRDVHIYQSAQNRGIQEKYILGLLNKTHWLTDLDIHRTLKHYKLDGQIKITPFTEPSLRATIDLAVRDNASKSEAYTINLMLNRGSIGSSQGSHWLSSQVTIDPIGKKISYLIDDSLRLSAEEIQQYKATIEEALSDKAGEFHNPFPASGGWTIDQKESKITGHGSQTDGYSCGYRALRQLVSNPSICGVNVNAVAFSSIPTDSETLVKHIFYHQLKDLNVSADVFGSLSTRDQGLFSESFGSESKVRVIDTGKLDVFIAESDKTPAKKASADHQKVEAAVGEFRQDLSLLNFPLGAKDNSLTAVEYERFFSKLDEIEKIEQSNLKVVRLPYVTSDALDGITRYFTGHPSTSVKELVLVVAWEAPANKEAFLSKLKLSISTLSNAGLEKIDLRDELSKLDQKELTELKDFAVTVGLTCKIKLPVSYARSPLQRDLDREVERNQQKKNKSTLSGEHSVTSEKSTAKSIRRREKLDFNDQKQADIELQDSVEAELAIEMVFENAQESTDFALKKTFDLKDLETAVNENNFSAFANLEVIMKKEDFVKAWHQVFGNIVQGELQIGAKSFFTIGNQTVHGASQISKISVEALQQLLKDGHLPTGGIDFQHLPQGFVLINDDKKQGGRILHHDADYKKPAVIAPKLADKPSATPLSTDTVDEIMATLPPTYSLQAVWVNMNASDTYDANKNQLFREIVLDVLSLPSLDQDQLIQLCGGADNLNLDRMKAFFKNRSELASLYKDPFDAANILNVSLIDRSLHLTGSDVDVTRAGLIKLASQAGVAPGAKHPLLQIISISAHPDIAPQLSEALDKYHLTPPALNDITRVYSNYGAAGVSKVLTTWQAISTLKTITPAVAAQIIANSSPLKDIILSQDLATSCNRLNDFSQNKRDWFLQLYAKHAPKSDKNFVDLLSSFTEFSRQVNVHGLPFYSLEAIADPFTANIDMQTAMGRMASIMDACKKTDLNAQWERIAEIDLGPSAAINAVQKNVRNRRCSFVIPEMEIDPKREDLTGLTGLTPYDTVGEVTAIAPQNTHDGDEAKAVQKRFFRYLSTQEHRMPLAFYTKAVRQIEEMGVSTKIERTELNTLYRLLAEITTGKNYQYFIHDERTAENQWENILKQIKDAQLQLNPVAYKLACTVSGCDVNAHIYKELISNLGQLHSVPSIDVMDKLVNLMTSSIAQYNKGTITVVEFQASMKRLAQSNHALRQLTDQYHDKIYMGMKFYDQASYDKRYSVPQSMRVVYGEQVNLLDHHTLVVDSFLQKRNVEFTNFAIPLISTFSLGHDNIEELYALHQRADSLIKSSLMRSFATIFLDIKDNSACNEASLNTLMSHLLQEEGLFAQIESSIKASFNEILGLQDKQQKNTASKEEMHRFSNLCAVKNYTDYNVSLDDVTHEAINQLAKNKVAAFIETNELLKAALPEAYADRLKAQKDTGALTLLIDAQFKTQELKAQVEKIRVKFSDQSDDKQHKIINDVATILGQCDTESEKQEVATTLANQQLLSEGEEAYSKLLDTVKKSSGSFLYYMQQAQLYTARNKDTPIEGLCEKAAYFIGSAIPALARRYKNLSVVECAPLIFSVISAGRPTELRDRVDLGDNLVKWQGVYTSLSAAQTDSVELERILGGLEPRQKSALHGLKALQEHLERLNNPTITKEVIDSIKEEVAAPGVNMTEALKTMTYTSEKVNQPTNALRRFGAFFGVSNAEEAVTKHYKTTTTYKGLDDALVNQVLKQAQEQKQAAVTYGHALTESIAIIDKLIEDYPSAKSMLLPLTKNYLEYKGEALASDAHIKKAYGNLKNLSQELAVLDDKDMVISLCEHFSHEGKYKFTDLMTIFNGGNLAVGDKTLCFSNYPTLNKGAKKQLFTVITSLLNNKKTCELADIEQLITHFNGEHGQQYLDAVTAIYSKAPYPELSQFYQWSPKSLVLNYITEQYNTWSKKPIAREDDHLDGEEPVNGFHLPSAKEQSANMSGIKYTSDQLEKIKVATDTVKDSTTSELLEQIKAIRENPEKAKSDPTDLVALLSELLYRTKGMPQEGAGNARKWGRSFEINTIQYLAVHSLLKSDKPTIAGIGTGEGKSRIMMISLGAQWALGRTVDFVTADVTLATRDYLEYLAYFKSFGAKTSLITAQTPMDQYCKDGINFSDASNLSLFRNKARSQGLGDKVINPEKADRCLLLDEADKTLFDAIDTRYNYSAQADQSIQHMPWIYEELVKFFKDSEHEAWFHGPTSDADECNRKFKAFVKANLSSAKDIQKLERVSRSQLESWQASAITALNLEYGKDFTLESNVPIVTKKGPGIVSQARLISGGAALKNAKFSFGVHQCLHARLNLEKGQVLTQGRTKDNLLHEELSKKEFNDRRFPVDSENQIIYSSTSKALVDDYDVIRGVTGTPGAWTERAEKANMAFIDIPRHKGIHRIDRPYQLVKDNGAQFQQIIAEIRKCIRNKQPILLICKDDNESKQLFDYLRLNMTAGEQAKLCRVSADTSIAKESMHVENDAGQLGAITVTTARMGRGTDIKLQGEAKTNGLHVVGTYLPRERGYVQIVGRAGRFGAQGSSRLILSEDSMRGHFNSTGKVPQDFYTATESYLEHLKMTMDIQSQKQRIVKDAVSDFRMNLTRSFFDKFFQPLAAKKDVNNDLIIGKWLKFFDASDKIWNETWPKISEALANKKMDRVESLLQEYHAEVQGYWKGMIGELKTDFTDNKAVDFSVLPEDVGNIKLSQRGIELLKYDVGTNHVFKTHIADNYDEAYKGRAVILKGFWQNLRHNVLPSIFSWNDTHFTQARKNGNMTWSQFLLGGNLGAPPQTTESKFVSSLDDKTAMELVNIQVKGSSSAKILNLLEATAPATIIPVNQRQKLTSTPCIGSINSGCESASKADPPSPGNRPSI